MNSDLNIKLNVNELSQLDTTLGIAEAEKRLVCSMVSTKILLEYHLPNSELAKATPMQIKEMMREFGGKNDVGQWQHKTQVEVLKKAGLVAWRRNWRSVSSGLGLRYFELKESYDKAQMRVLSAQVAKEELEGSEQAKITRSLVDSLKAGNPVIISLGTGPGFDVNRHLHQAVLVGYKKEENKEEYIIVDPDTEPGKSAVKIVDVGLFYMQFRCAAIFAQKPASA